MQGKGAQGLSGLQEKQGGLCQEEGSSAVSFEGRGQPWDRLDVDKEKEMWYREKGKGELFPLQDRGMSHGRRGAWVVPWHCWRAATVCGWSTAPASLRDAGRCAARLGTGGW